MAVFRYAAVQIAPLGMRLSPNACGRCRVFGYVKPVVGSLLVREHEFYKATYCGICRSMKKHTGTLSNVTITYDSVLLALVRMAYIPDAELSVKRRRCIAHPLRSRPMLEDNSAIEYTARAFAVLSYYKLMDDLHDESFGKRLAVGTVRPILSSAKKKAREKSLEQIAAEKLAAIDALEAAECPSPDEPAQLFGELLGEIFSHGLDGEGKIVTYQLGLHLGRFIYCADAADDYSEDVKRGRYNPYVLTYGGEELTAEHRETIKRALLFECRSIQSAINLIPFGNKATVENIVRNIVFEGLPERLCFLDDEDIKEKKE
jgi:hypothetical protein